MNIFDSNDILNKNFINDELSIVVVTYKRIILLQALVASIHKAVQSHQNYKCRVVICINGYDPDTEHFLRSCEQKTEAINLQIISLNKAVTPAEARNIATMGVRSDWVLFLDDDVEVPEDLFKNFQELAESDPQASLWGGPNLTPHSSSIIQQKIGYLLQSFLVTGPISSRYKFNNIYSQPCSGTYFSLCNIFIKTQEFKSILFNCSLKTAEENELIYKLSRQNKKMIASDSLYVWHSRRESIPHFLMQIKNYGYGRGQLIYGGQTSIINLSSIILIIFVFLIITTYYPLPIICFLAMWQALIFIKLKSKIKYKDYNIFDILLPLRLWINYLIGIVGGIFNSYRVSKN